MPARSCRYVACAAASGLAALLAIAAPQTAGAVSADSSLGTPTMYLVTGKIPPPFEYRFNLSTAVSAWPALAQTVSLGPQDLDAAGVLQDDRVFSSFGPTYNNQVVGYADTRGTYGCYSDMTQNLSYYPYVPESYVGTFSYAQWSQSFVKDSLTSWCSFTSSYSGLRARSVASDTGRAEFALTALLTKGASLLESLSQKSGLLAWTPTATGPTQFATWFVGPMPVPVPTDPSGAGVARQYLFAPFTHFFDLSALAVGDTFTVTMEAMTQAAIGWGELPGARAAFRDPVTGSGITFAKHACTPVDGLPPQTLAVPAPASAASLSPAWPNPARGDVFLAVQLPAAGRLVAEVFDLLGRRVATLADGDAGAGAHLLEWRPAGGARPAAAGVYFVRVDAPGVHATRRVVRIAS